MIHREYSSASRAVAIWLIAGISVAGGVMAWFSYHATRQWRRSSELLVQRGAEQTADRLVMALLRDMRGAQESVLKPLHWDQVDLEKPYELSDLVASTFARYPYPEAFFAWSGTSGPTIFFTRSNRRPHWLPADGLNSQFPVAIVYDSAAAKHVLERVLAAGAEGRRYSAFEARLGDESYQVVARLVYRAGRPEHAEAMFGFLVNLDWVRKSYFSELMDQVADVTNVGAGSTMAIVDDEGSLVAGKMVNATDVGITTRRFRPLFFDPAAVALGRLEGLPEREWAVQVSATSDPTLAFAARGADRTLLITGVAALVLGVGLLLAVRAIRASADLAQVRSDFVSSVTHELKAPLATIQAAAETLVRGRVPSAHEIGDYAQIMDQEAKRLTRLITNLLAYSRVTDVGQLYAFEPVAVVELIDDTLRGFQPQLVHKGFDVDVEISSDLPPVRADRTAIRLVLDNIIDNALRYSGESRWLGLAVCREADLVHIKVSDRGVGIPPDEIGPVTMRFVRGRHARSDGSGLGLAIASRIVADHAGRLSIDSRIGTGTTVDVALPLMEP